MKPLPQGHGEPEIAHRLLLADRLAGIEARTAEASAFLKLLANNRRLMLLCVLCEHAELPAGELAARVGLSQSALSQHLARLRADGLVAFRRDGLMLHYRLADARVRPVLATLRDIFCPA